MPVDRLLVQSLAVAQLTGADSYTSTPASNSHLFTNQLRDAILAVDGNVVRAICESGNHGRRRDYIVSVALAHGAQIPSHVGPIDAVRIAGLAATPWDPRDIEMERVNALGVPLQPHFAVDNARIYHNGTVASFGVSTADLDHCAYAMDTSGSLCQAPVEYADAVLCGTLEYLFGVEGDDVAAANLYGRTFQMYLQMIKGGAMNIPSLGAIQQEAA